MMPHPHTPARIIWRWFTGAPLDGQPRTDATWLVRGTVVWHRTGRASTWSRLPRLGRAAWRTGSTVAVVAAVIAYRLAPVPTLATAAAAGTGALATAARAAVRGIRSYRYRRTVIRPLVAGLAPLVEMPGPDIARRLSVPGPDTPAGTGRISVPVPDHWAGRVAQVADVSRVVAHRLGGEWDTTLNMRRHPFYVHFTPTPAPPGAVPFDLVAAAVLATTQDRPVLGLGARSEVLHLDFTGEIAHLAASIGTGGGKSSFLRFLVAQFAHHGVRDFTVCDVKWVSLQGMESVPGLHVYRDVEAIWDALALARADMDRRYGQMLADPARTFPRKVILLEEQNAFALETVIRWREVRPQGDKRATAPVWNDIALLLLKGRQVNINIVGVYQRMSAEASGGGTYRDQYGLKLLSRFGPAAWDTLVGTRPRGVSSVIPGRAIAILGGLHRTVQLPYITVDEALALATSGPVTAPVSDPSPQVPAPAGRDVTADQEPRYGLAEASREPWCPVSYDALRQRASRGRAAGTWPAGERWTRTEILDALAPDRVDA